MESGLEAQPVDAAGSRTTFEYDAVGRLQAVTDAVLERVSDARAVTGFNQLTGITANNGDATSFAYDGNGNQTAKTDGSGTTQYVYDADNRLVGIALPSGVTNAFEYDANGLRTKKTDSSGTTAYLLDGMSVVAQYTPGGQRQAWYTQSLARIDEVLSVVNGQGKYWYQNDALGSVYTLANGDGTVRARGGYDVFGAPVAEYGQSVGQPFGFTGREHELESGLVYARARYLSPAVGRWDRPDPWGFFDNIVLYGFVRSSPTNFTDPTGRYAEPMHNFIISQALPPRAGQERQWLQESSFVADTGPGAQDGINSFKHAMRYPGQSTDDAVRQWREFLLDQLANGLALADGSCFYNLRPTTSYGMTPREAGVREMGLGAHALMDLFSPVHQFRVWNGFVKDGKDHFGAESKITVDHPSVREAIRALRTYYEVFDLFAGSGRGLAGQLSAIEMAHAFELQAWERIYFYE